MRPDETVLFTDLDGTLFDSHGQVSERNREAIARYVEAGGLFAISTGRLPENALTFLAGLPLNGPCVVVNGGGIYDFTSGSFSHTHYMDREVIDPLFRHVIETYEHADVQLVTPEGIIYLTAEETAQPELLETHRPCRFLDWADIEDVPFFKALLYAPEPEGTALGQELRAAAEGNFRFMEYVSDSCGGLRFFEVMPLEVNKGVALKKLRDDPRIAGRTFFACGDYLNDCELISEADVGIAVANAILELKEIAQRETLSNDESAIAHVIDVIIPET